MQDRHGTAGPPSDEDVAAAFCAGDDRALVWAYERWAGLVHGLVTRALGAGAAADDLTQQVFVGAWQGRSGYRPGLGPLPGWLVGLTRQRIAEELGRRAREDRRTAVPGASDRLALLEELSRIGQPQRGIMELAIFHGLTHDQISARTGLPVRTVRSHIGRTLLSLRHRLEVSGAAL